MACHGLNLVRMFVSVTRTRRLTSAEARTFHIGDMPCPKSSSNSQEKKRTFRLIVVHAGVDIIDSSQQAEQCANWTTIFCLAVQISMMARSRVYNPIPAADDHAKQKRPYLVMKVVRVMLTATVAALNRRDGGVYLLLFDKLIGTAVYQSSWHARIRRLLIRPGVNNAGSAMKHVFGYTQHVPSKPSHVDISGVEHGEVRPLGYSPQGKHSAIN